MSFTPRNSECDTLSDTQKEFEFDREDNQDIDYTGTSNARYRASNNYGEVRTSNLISRCTGIMNMCDETELLNMIILIFCFVLILLCLKKIATMTKRKNRRGPYALDKEQKFKSMV
ncbi:hypothetical protein THOM_2686 [Trachipleistophora hominis]|uniref:Uncharacterized protein n=1 Tax=Trachipleistophora hominis TaxID=72359 RepID=L7JSC9_TRAHO|nr:hypothetical protein THOM_2686 [Trachipleistophora hominis]